jgi:DNA repair exonuclease SbcCD ATPase subunit
MRNYKNALKHINKEKLSTQKIELALIDDFNEVLDTLQRYDKVIGQNGQKLFNAYSDIQSIGNKLDSAYEGAYDFIDDAEQEIKKAENIVNKLAASAKELGIDPKSIKGTKEIVKVTANLEDTINTLNKFKSDIKKILNSL